MNSTVQLHLKMMIEAPPVCSIEGIVVTPLNVLSPNQLLLLPKPFIQLNFFKKMDLFN